MNFICTHCDRHYNGVMCKKENTWESTCPLCNETNILIPPEAPIIMMYTDAIDPIDSSDNPYKYFTDNPNTDYICNYFTFDTPTEFISEWKRIVNEPRGMWYWVIENGECICSGAPDPYDIEIFNDHWKLDKISFDRATALEVLKDISREMYPSNDLFGTKTLVINRKAFEKIRKKYLDSKEN